MVERRREQAAEGVPVPLGLRSRRGSTACIHAGVLWRGARQGGVVERRREQAAEMVERRLPAPCGRADKAGKDQALPGPLPRGRDSGVIGVIQFQHAQGVVREII